MITPLFAYEPDKEFHEKCLYPTVLIICPDKSTGTGVIIHSEKTGNKYKNIVLSCEHVTGKASGLLSLLKTSNKDLTIRKGNYENWSTLISFDDYDGKVLFSDEETDMSIIGFLSDQQMPIVAIDINPNLYINNEVFRIGCGVGEFVKVDYGRITAVNAIGNESKRKSDVIRTSIPTIMGDSGGPSFYKTKDGYRCFGLCHSVRGVDIVNKIPLSEGFLEVPHKSLVYHISYIIPLKRIEEQLKEYQ
jgi:hypothetical protein